MVKMTLSTSDLIAFIKWVFKCIGKCLTWIKSWKIWGKIWGKIKYFRKMYIENLRIYKYTNNKYTKSLLENKIVTISTEKEISEVLKTWIYTEDGYTIIVFEIDGKKYLSKFIRWKFLSPFCIYRKNTGIRICLLEYVKICRYYRDPISYFPYKKDIIDDMLKSFIRYL